MFETNMETLPKNLIFATVFCVLTIFFLTRHRENRCITLTRVAADPSASDVSSFEACDKECQYEQWLKTFTASDPAYQDWCFNILKTGAGSSSQFEQDIFLFMNVYKYWPMEGRVGFYVDSGANDAEQMSNTFFYDKCLGWKGLCVEPLIQYHEKIRKLRSCTLFPECVSDKKRFVNMGGVGAGAFVDEKAKIGSQVQCDSIQSMLSRSGNAGVEISLWSLDVEGHEMTILKDLNYAQVNVLLFLIEDFWLSARELDLFMSQHSFLKYHQLAIDSVFVNRTRISSLQTVVWYPTRFQEFVESNNQYRESVKGQLKC